MSTDRWFDDSILEPYLSSFNKHSSATQTKNLFIGPSGCEVLKIGSFHTVNTQCKQLKFYTFITPCNNEGTNVRY